MVDKIVIDTLKEFRDKIERTGIVDRNECLSIEGRFELNLFSGSKVINYTTIPGTTAGVYEVKREINRFLDENIPDAKEIYSYSDIIYMLNNAKKHLDILIGDFFQLKNVDQTKIDAFKNDSLALTYDDGVLDNTLDNPNPLLTFANYNFITSILNKITNNEEMTDRICQDLLYVINDKISPLISETNSSEYFYPLLSRLYMLSKSVSKTITINDVIEPVIDPLTFRKLLSLAQGSKYVLDKLILLRTQLNTMTSISNKELITCTYTSPDEEPQKLYKTLRIFNQIFGVDSDDGSIDYYVLKLLMLLLVDRSSKQIKLI